jgi:membrane protease YdiL (CAAX protease family)
MLSPKPWKPEAMVRLLLSVFICIFAGSLVVAALHYSGKSPLKFYSIFAASLGFLIAAVVWLRQPWRLEDFMRRVAVVLVCFYAGLLLGAWSAKMAGTPGPSVGQMLVTALSFQGMSLILVGLFLREHQMGWVEAFGLSNQCRHALLLGVVVAGLFLPVGLGLQVGSAELIDWAGKKLAHYHVDLKPKPQEAIQTLELAMTWWDRFALGIVTMLLAPLAEEILFRGLLYPWVKQAGFPRLALWFTSFLFAAVHLNLMTFPPLFVLALALALLYERTDNLLAPITAHALFNSFNFVLFYSLQQHWGKMQ